MPYDDIRMQLVTMPEDCWDRYDNPFEQKWVLKKKAYTPKMYAMIAGLHSQCPPDCVIDDGHYTAIFKYEVGDYLDVHLDAGVHPKTKQRKAYTLLLYLSTDNIKGGTLVLPHVSIAPTFGTRVLFENTDDSWHGNPYPVEAGVRFVATVSFMSDSHDGYTNMRERAYFIPSVRDWDDATYALRDKRADPERYAEVYAVQ